MVSVITVYRLLTGMYVIAWLGCRFWFITHTSSNKCMHINRLYLYIRYYIRWIIILVITVYKPFTDMYVFAWLRCRFWLLLLLTLMKPLGETRWSNNYTIWYYQTPSRFWTFNTHLQNNGRSIKCSIQKNRGRACDTLRSPHRTNQCATSDKPR